MSTLLNGLKQHSIVVADTGDFAAMRKYQPRDATTNPSLLLKAATMPEYADLVGRVVADAKQAASTSAGALSIAMDRLAVAFGVEILKIVPNRVSTEVDARLSFDTRASIEKALTLISLYEAAGIPRERVLIKLAATWEGIEAARHLRQYGIRSNLTLLFSFAQAVACADRPELSVRQTAVRAIGLIGGPEARAAVPRLIELLDDPDRATRKFTAIALGDLGAISPEIRPALEEHADDPQGDVRAAVQNALARLAHPQGTAVAEPADDAEGGPRS